MSRSVAWVSSALSFAGRRPPPTLSSRVPTAVAGDAAIPSFAHVLEVQLKKLDERDGRSSRAAAQCRRRQQGEGSEGSEEDNDGEEEEEDDDESRDSPPPSSRARRRATGTARAAARAARTTPSRAGAAPPRTGPRPPGTAASTLAWAWCAAAGSRDTRARVRRAGGATASPRFSVGRVDARPSRPGEARERARAAWLGKRRGLTPLQAPLAH